MRSVKGALRTSMPDVHVLSACTHWHLRPEVRTSISAFIIVVNR